MPAAPTIAARLLPTFEPSQSRILSALYINNASPNDNVDYLPDLDLCLVWRSEIKWVERYAKFATPHIANMKNKCPIELAGKEKPELEGSGFEEVRCYQQRV
jgi:hypothetical protein